MQTVCSDKSCLFSRENKMALQTAKLHWSYRYSFGECRMILSVSIDKRMLQVDQERAVEYGPSWASLMDNSTKDVAFTGVQVLPGIEATSSSWVCAHYCLRQNPIKTCK